MEKEIQIWSFVLFCFVVLMHRQMQFKTPTWIPDNKDRLLLQTSAKKPNLLCLLHWRLITREPNRVLYCFYLEYYCRVRAYRQCGSYYFWQEGPPVINKCLWWLKLKDYVPYMSHSIWPTWKDHLKSIKSSNILPVRRSPCLKVIWSL